MNIYLYIQTYTVNYKCCVKHNISNIPFYNYHSDCFVVYRNRK